MKNFIAFCFLLSVGITQAQEFLVASIPENLKKNANAVIRIKTSEYIFKSVDDLSSKEHYAVTVLDKAGDHFSEVYIPYSPTTRVSGIKVNMYDALGKLIKTYSKKDFSDFTYDISGALYNDDRILVLKPMSTAYPYTVETIYEENTSNTYSLDSFTPFYLPAIALEKASYKLINNSGIKVRTKIKDNEFGKVTYSENGNISEYSYKNIPAIQDEPLSPSMMYLSPKVEFSPEKFSLEHNQGDLTSWDSFGKWYYSKLINPVSEITPEISAEIVSLNLSGSTSDKVKKIYQYMQNKTRYVLISMGVGGWQPMRAAEVDKKGYGDCKALTNYMRTLLQAAGIQSYFSLIFDDRTEIKFDENFPRLAANHAILVIPTNEGNIWLENTSQIKAFNHLAYTSHNRNVVAIKENGAELINTPVYKPDESKEIMKAQVTLNDDQSITTKSDFLFTGGQYDGALSLFRLNKDEIKEVLKNRHYNLKISEISVDNLTNNRDNAQVTFNMNFKASGFSKKLGNDMFFPVMAFYEPVAFSSNDERTLPFENSFPFQDDYEIEYTIPNGYQFTDLPETVNYSSEFGSYTLSFQIKNQKLNVHRILIINKGLYPKEKFKDYVAFRKKTASFDNTKILITKL